MSVAEFRDKFIELSRYTPEEVADDGKKQELFLDGLSGPLQYLLMSHTFPTFQSMVGSAIRLEYKSRELGEQKRKATSRHGKHDGGEQPLGRSDGEQAWQERRRNRGACV
jgi:hypothetical protein